MKRIVEEHLLDGTLQYRVESKTTLFGFTIRDWHTDALYQENKDGFGELKDAVFDSFDKAQRFCHIEPNPVVERKIVYYEPYD